MRLYDLSVDYQQIQELMEQDSSGSEDYRQALEDTFESINESYDLKIENSVKVLNQIKSDIETIGNEIKRLQGKKKSLENNLDSFKEYLKDSMEMTGKTKVKTPLFSVWVQDNPQSLKVKSEDNIPKDYFIKQPDKLNKKDLLKHIKETGELIEGVELVQTRGLRYR